jgi:hypothetical protein
MRGPFPTGERAGDERQVTLNKSVTLTGLLRDPTSARLIEAEHEVLPLAMTSAGRGS